MKAVNRTVKDRGNIHIKYEDIRSDQAFILRVLVR